jgi:HlyD family secretion protein
VDSPLSALKGSVVAKVLVGAVAVGALGGAGWFGYRTWGPGGAPAVTDAEQIVPVQRGDLVSSVSVNGTLTYPNRAALTFTSGGTVASIAVASGQNVAAGQELAKLDAGTIANLESAVAQARVNVRNAADALAQAKTPDAVKLAQAKLDVQNAQAALDALLNPSALPLTQARLDVQNAGDALASLLSPSALALTQAESAVASARLALQNAEKARDDFLDTSSAAQLQSALLTAETSLRNAADSLSVTKASWDAKLPPVRTSHDTALDAYRAAFAKYLGIDISDDPAPGDPDTVLAAYGIDLATVYKSVPAVALADGAGVPADDPATPWNETTISLWKTWYPGTLTPVCETAPIQQGAACISVDLDKAWTQYQTARDNLAAQENQAATAIAASEAAVEKAKSARDLAKVAYDSGPGQATIEVNDRNVAVAAARLADAERSLATLKQPDALQVALKQAQLDAACDKLLDVQPASPAQAALKDAQIEASCGGRTTAASTEDGQLALRRAQLDTARENLLALEQGDQVLIDLLQSSLNTANAALESAQARLAGATIKAPWAGRISAVNASVGDSVTANLAVLEMVDPTRVQLGGSLDEIDVLFVQEGAAAEVTLDALAGASIQGEVTEIASQGQTNQGVVTFSVTIDVTAPQGVALREGLSATATIVLNQESNVLLIPVQAVTGTFAEPVVRVTTGKDVSYRNVTLGNSDGFWVAVTGGLEEGERVVMAAPETSSTQGGNLRGLGGLGGLGGVTIIGGGPGGPGFRQEFQQGANSRGSGAQSGNQRSQGGTQPQGGGGGR